MLLKSIKYYNFRPFIGEQKVDLSKPSDKPNSSVTVILGDNTHGKSTFVLSFIWCLYGESRFSRPKDILNKKVEKSMENGSSKKVQAYVEVEFEDDNKQYTMRRTQRFTKNYNGQLVAEDSFANLTYVDENGETKSVGHYESDINNAIKAILPLDLSSFFFFEGEKNNEIKRKDLGKAVRTLLGLEAYDKMRVHLHGSSLGSPSSNSVMGEYLKKQKDESGELAKNEFAKKEKAEKEYDCAKKRIDELDKQIKEYEDLREKMNEKLRQAEPSRELQKRRDEIERSILRVENNIKNKSKEFLSTFSKESLPLFMYPLLEEAKNKLSKMNATDKGIKGIEAKAIRELLNRGVCLCGTDLKEGSLAYKNVEKYIEYVPPRSLGVLVNDMLENIDEAREKGMDFIEKFEKIYKDIMEEREELNRLESEDRDVLSKLSQIDTIDVKDIKEKLYRYRNKIKEFERERDSQRDICSSKKYEIEQAQRSFNKLKSKSDKAKKYQLYYKYAEALYNWVNDTYSEKENDLRKRLNNYISELFNNMYSGHREINIDEKYNINMTYNGDVVDDTGGLRVIQYFAYVGGLVKLAYEVMKEREVDDEGNQQSLGEQYPLVLDAAFSHADETHTKNIARELSNSVNQLVLAIMQKDWIYAKEGLKEKVGRMYELRKIDETEVKIVEV